MLEMPLILKVLVRVCMIYLPLAVIERIFRFSKPSSSIRRWWLRFSFLASLKILLGALAGLIFAFFFLQNFTFLAPARLFWSGLPWAVGFVALVLIHSFTFYWAHRLLHYRLLWRSHQMHHSPDRFDVSLDLYAHPIDFVVVVTALAGTVFLCGFGLSHYLALGTLHNALSMGLHLRVRTPQWLGYIIFRPEQHGGHHSLHNVNYGIIPIWDQVFGTFENRSAVPEKFGLSQEAQSQFWPMFFLRNTD